MSADQATERVGVAVEEALEFFELPDIRATAGPRRVAEVRAEIAATGTYAHTYEELRLGAILAWRNHARCIGRVSWKSLEVIDLRAASTPAEIFEGCWDHLRFSTNRGKLRAAVTVFAPRWPTGEELRILNPQLVRYAGYRGDDGAVLGDPLHVNLTEFAQRLGWRGAGTPFDVLPVILSMPDGNVVWEQPPEDAVMEVPIRHPEYPALDRLSLRWHANPAIANMDLQIGGLHYTAAPFSGWYLASEIGARNLTDPDRYNLMPAVAECLGLDTSADRTLWKDKALVELTYAVLDSFRSAGVRILDHHTAASQFVRYVDSEENEGRSVCVDWQWLFPPISASATATFHRPAGFTPPRPAVRPDFVYFTDSPTRLTGDGHVTHPKLGACPVRRV